MNKIEPSNRQVRKRGSLSSEEKKKLQKKRKLIGMIASVVMAVVGVVIISLLILMVKSFFPSSSTDNESSSQVNSSILAGSLEGDLDFNYRETIYMGRPNVALTPKPLPATESDITDLPVHVFQNMITVGDKGYECYKFNTSLADKFAMNLNSSFQNVDHNVNIYSMIIPSAIDVMLPESFLAQYDEKTSYQEKAIRYINSKIDGRVKKIDAFSVLKSHCDEKLYYNSESKFTSLAAFYLYNELRYFKKLEPHSSLSYGTQIIPGFRGYISAFLGIDELSGTENIELYTPNANLSMNDNQKIFADVEDSSPRGKINVFLGGERAVTTIENDSMTAGPIGVVVGDSVAYTLVPFIAQDYKELYFIDYRKFEGSVSDFVKEKNAADLIYCTNILATNNEALINGMD